MPSAFDPFGDYASAGYLRNVASEKDLALVKQAEHQLFRAQLPKALDFLSTRKRIEYSDFLQVHHILFHGLYPWAGQDRAATFPGRLVTRGNVFFCDPRDCQRAVSAGLSLAQDDKRMAIQPGHIMGLFAYGHPFLDGNGRTMLLVHAELCFRAGMSIDWTQTRKAPYLEALTMEIEDPHTGHLDGYLQPFIAGRTPRDQWLMSVSEMAGLDGAHAGSDTTADFADPGVTESYRQFERRRSYNLDNNSS